MLERPVQLTLTGFAPDHNVGDEVSVQAVAFVDVKVKLTCPPAAGIEVVLAVRLAVGALEGGVGGGGAGSWAAPASRTMTVRRTVRASNPRTRTWYQSSARTWVLFAIAGIVTPTRPFEQGTVFSGYIEDTAVR